MAHQDPPADPFVKHTDSLLPSVAMVVRQFSMSGGLELYTHRLVEGLLARGIKVTVICQEWDSPLKDEKLTCVCFSSPPKGSAKWQKIMHDHSAASAAVRQAGPFDIVHSQHLPMSGANVVTFHNQTATRIQQVGKKWETLLNRTKVAMSRAYRLRQAQDADLCRQARCLIFSSQVCRDDFVNTYNLGERGLAKCVVAYPGADFPDLENNRTDQAKDGFTFLFVGKGYRKKGLDILLDAMSILKKRKVNCRLIIAGMRHKPIESLRLSRRGVANCVQFLGFQKNMNAVYEQAQAIVLPSRMEPFGMAPLQAMHKGLVPIVSAVCGVAEVLRDGEDSLILKNHLDARELADLMQTLVENKELYNTLSSRAFEASSHVSWQKTVDATLQGYWIALGKTAAFTE